VISGENQIEHTVQEISSKVAIFYNDDIIISIHRLEHCFIEDLIPRYIETQKLKTTEEVAIKLVKGALRSFEKFQNQLNHHIDRIEDKIFLKNNSENFLKELYFLKRQSNIGKKLLLLTREVINGIRSHHKVNIDLRDAMDLHVKLELFYDQLSEDVNNLLTIYLSVSSQKTNEVMKVLTGFSVFFLPLTFIVGVYGMNFEFMPELHYQNAYPMVWAVMIVVVILIGIWFKKRKWL
jgi:magnesium transporter